jgi:hypothetical protein
MPLLFAALFATVAFFAPPAAAGPNPQYCFMLQTNFNQCVQRETRRHQHYEEEYDEWGGPPPWAHHHHPRENCNAWLAQIHAAGCD